MKASRSALLGDICEFRYGRSLPANQRLPGNVTVFGSNGPVGRHSESLLQGPAIVVGRKGSLGEIHFSERALWPIDTTYYIDETATECDLRWLYYLLKHLPLTSLNKSAAIPGLNREDAYRLSVLVPPLDEQRRIAAILDKADALRRQRKRAIEQIDRITQSTFFELFGHTSDEVLQWGNPVALADLADIGSGITKGRKLNGQKTREVPYMAVVNVQDRRLDLSTIKMIEASEEEISRYRLADGDLLLTEGGDPDKLGRGTLWAGELPEAIHQNHIFRVRVRSDSLLPLFLNWLVSSPYGKRYFLNVAKQTTGIASINKTQLSQFPTIVPPIEVQQRFVDVANAVAAETKHLLSSSNSIDFLFSSLQHRAFSGQL
ncbi:type I restriction enzyme S subunit [Rhodopseudomonas faecalis]|uniref:Type I restriction enzyme S subunit n=1 Tax=Rhodopseudomonas faecalis TaxID=99655 RepID=A0A318TH63_9BRAD|nr:restriction endonuclease subunit S [Rhodopseudomonas faecalis]PYF01125.1 type I restriction enzyme S subunit [Rhodopseudomonas faecalis]